MIALFTGDGEKSGHDLVRDYWQGQRPEKDRAFEALWETSLHDGVVAGTTLPAISVSPRPDFVNQGNAQAAHSDASRLEVVFRPDPSIGDGKFANNGWLQELPKPVTRLTWDNAVPGLIIAAGGGPMTAWQGERGNPARKNHQAGQRRDDQPRYGAAIGTYVRRLCEADARQPADGSRRVRCSGPCG